MASDAEMVSQLSSAVIAAGDYLYFIDLTDSTDKKYEWNSTEVRDLLGLGTGDSPTLTGLTISGSAGIDCNPGSDVDTDLVTVGVTGNPLIKWDESENAFSQNFGLRMTGGVLSIGTTPPDGTYGITAQASSGTLKTRFETMGSVQYSGVQFQLIGHPSTSNQSGARFGYTIKDAAGAYGEFFIQQIDESNNFVQNLLRYDMQNDAWYFYTAGSEVARFTSTGRLGVKTTGPAGTLHVDQSSDSAGIPAVIIDQADISEEYCLFVGESDGASADRCLVDPSEFTTPGAVLVWLKAKVQDIRSGGGVGTIDIWLPGYAIPTA